MRQFQTDTPSMGRQQHGWHRSGKTPVAFPDISDLGGQDSIHITPLEGQRVSYRVGIMAVALGLVSLEVLVVQVLCLALWFESV